MKKLWNFVQRLLGRSDIWINGILYMKRWKFGWDSTPGFRLHNIIKSDLDRELHDHPFSFLSIILRGGYYEYLADGTKTWHGPGSILWRPATTLHRIELAKDKGPASAKRLHFHFDAEGNFEWDEPAEKPAWTFVLRSRHLRDWGFMTDKGWVRWNEFVSGKGAMVAEANGKKEFACKSST